MIPIKPAGGRSMSHLNIAGMTDSVFGGKTHVLCACTEQKIFNAGSGGDFSLGGNHSSDWLSKSGNDQGSQTQ